MKNFLHYFIIIAIVQFDWWKLLVADRAVASLAAIGAPWGRSADYKVGGVKDDDARSFVAAGQTAAN